MSVPRHISLCLDTQEALLRHSLYAALLEAALTILPTNPTPLQVLDVGSGRGEVLRLLAEHGCSPTGLDLEPGCVEAGRPHGRCLLGGIEEIPRLFQPGEFDVVICSHVLEHVDSPYAALQTLAALGAVGYVFAVPNPLRPLRILRALFGSKRADHPEHVYAWGHAEFAALLARCGFQVERWYPDRVTMNPFHGRLGAALTRWLRPLESGLVPKVFPMFSSSIIVRCHLEKLGRDL